MSKRKRARSSRSRYFSPDNPATPRVFREGMQEASALIAQKRWKQALEILEPLDRRYPGQPYVLNDLVYIYQELRDFLNLQHTLLRLLKVEPDNIEANFDLASTYLATMRPMLALQAYREFVERWPEHELAPKARAAIADLEADMPEIFEELEVAYDEAGIKLAILHEEMQVALSQSDFREVRRKATAILEDHPHFAPAHNNLSLAYWAQGNIERALETAQEVLTFEPHNVHALSNIIHYLCMLGQEEEAQSYAEPLLTSPALAAEKSLKQMEGLAFLEDYEAVLEVFHRAEKSGEFNAPYTSPMYFHLAAVASAHQANEKQAKRLWQRALRQQPGFIPAKENLEDLKRPVGERHGPYAFPLNSWINPEALADFEKALESTIQRKSDRAIASIMRRYVRQNPEIETLLPLLLRRGSPHAREFALHLAKMAETPAMLEALRDFAFSDWGPDGMRIETANFLIQHGTIASGTKRMYLKGEWHEGIMLLGFEIGDESEQDEHLSPRLEKMARTATQALHEGEWQKAERILKQALEQAPDSPSLLNNLALAYGMQGQEEKAHAMIRDIHERYPDYLFARASLARMAVQAGDLDRAHDLLEPLLERKKLHFTEFTQMASAFIELHLAEGKQEGAQSWLEMWEAVDPDNPKLQSYQMRVNVPGLARALKSWGRKT